MVTLTDKNFQTETNTGTCVVLFTNRADAEDIAAEEYFNNFPGIKFGVVYFDEERRLVHKYSIRRLPTYLLFLNGKIGSQPVYSLDQTKIWSKDVR